MLMLMLETQQRFVGLRWKYHKTSKLDAESHLWCFLCTNAFQTTYSVHLLNSCYWRPDDLEQLLCWDTETRSKRHITLLLPGVTLGRRGESRHALFEGLRQSMEKAQWFQLGSTTKGTKRDQTKNCNEKTPLDLHIKSKQHLLQLLLD